MKVICNGCKKENTGGKCEECGKELVTEWTEKGK